MLGGTVADHHFENSLHAESPAPNVTMDFQHTETNKNIWNIPGEISGHDWRLPPVGEDFAQIGRINSNGACAVSCLWNAANLVSESKARYCTKLTNQGQSCQYLVCHPLCRVLHGSNRLSQSHTSRSLCDAALLCWLKIYCRAPLGIEEILVYT